jgi:glycosyltransferase involved in cell wall biosynthesis
VTRVVHNPVDVERFDPRRCDRAAARARLGLEPEHVALLTVAQLTPWKAQDDAVRMLWLLRERHPEARLLVAGSVKFAGRQSRYDNRAYAKGLEDLIDSLGVRDKVWMLGERSDVADLLSAADVFLAPSWEEPFSISVLEAMAMRLPVVATAVGGLSEIVDGRNGLLLPPKRPNLWAHEIARLVDHPTLRTAMGGRARASVVSELDASRWVLRIVDVYHEVLGTGPEPALIAA